MSEKVISDMDCVGYAANGSGISAQKRGWVTRRENAQITAGRRFVILSTVDKDFAIATTAGNGKNWRYTVDFGSDRGAAIMWRFPQESLFLAEVDQATFCSIVHNHRDYPMDIFLAAEAAGTAKILARKSP